MKRIVLAVALAVGASRAAAQEQAVGIGQIGGSGNMAIAINQGQQRFVPGIGLRGNIMGDGRIWDRYGRQTEVIGRLRGGLYSGWHKGEGTETTVHGAGIGGAVGPRLSENFYYLLGGDYNYDGIIRDGSEHGARVAVFGGELGREIASGDNIAFVGVSQGVAFISATNGQVSETKSVRGGEETALVPHQFSRRGAAFGLSGMTRLGRPNHPGTVSIDGSITSFLEHGSRGNLNLDVNVHKNITLGGNLGRLRIADSVHPAIDNLTAMGRVTVGWAGGGR